MHGALGCAAHFAWEPTGMWVYRGSPLHAAFCGALTGKKDALLSHGTPSKESTYEAQVGAGTWGSMAANQATTDSLT